MKQFEEIMKKFFVRGILVCLISITASMSWAQNDVDVVFVMDGSSSISSVDFDLQKDGLVEAFSSSVIVPRDGSTSIALVQFAGTSTRTEINFTQINSDADIASIINQIQGINQLFGSTNPGDGVNTAMSILTVSGRPNASWSVCVSTDGLPNSGASLPVALSNGQSNGLDTFGVIAVEDPPLAVAADFQGFYGPLVFGGGGLQIVRNSVEFANGVGLSCLISDEARLVGLEVVQTIQDWEDTLPLVQNKETFVRAHFEPVTGTSALTSARLRGYRGTVELNGSPLAPRAPGFIVAQPDAASRRDNLTSSLNFQLPSDWLNGTIRLEVEGFGTTIACAEKADTDNDCTVEVTFQEVGTPEVQLVAVSHTSGTTTHTPTDDDLNELEDRLIAIFPISGLDRTNGSLSLTGSVDLSRLNSQLETLRIQDGCTNGCDRQYYGVLRNINIGGRANGIPGTVSSGEMPTNNLGYGRNRHAHELGHTLGLEHVTYCNARSSNPPAFPTSNTLTVGSQVRATIGPMRSGSDRLVYGLDTHRMAVVDPNDNYEMMSYCSSGRWRWVSDFTYNNLITNIDSVFGRRAVAPGFAWDPSLSQFLEKFEQFQARPGFVADTTQPQTLRADITEGFEDINNLPGWTTVNNSDIPGTTSWFQGNTDVFNAHAGAADSYIGANFNNTAGTVISNWLITPVLNFDTFQTLSFWTRTSTGSQFPDRLELRLSDNGSSTNVGATPSSVGDFTDLLLTINPSLQVGAYPNTWTRFEITRSDLPVIAGSGRVAFRYYVTSAGPTGINSDFIGIDSFDYQEQAQPASDYLLVRGIIDIDGGTVDFLPFDRLSDSSNPPSPDPGTYSLQVFDSSNQLLEEVSFEPARLHADKGPSGGGDPGESQFVIPVSMNANMAYIDLLEGSQQVGRKLASLNSPTIQITHPNGGEVLSTDEVTLNWSASDADGDPLTFSVQYSNDGGLTWKALAVDLVDDSWIIPKKLLPASTTSLLRVSANDGFFSVTDVSDGVFTVSNNKPNLSVTSPRPFSRFVGVELLHLNGRAYDAEDGALGNSRISFFSDRDGFLGYHGETINVSDLTEGTHTITISATDTEGSSSVKTTDIIISRVGTFDCSAVLTPEQWPDQTVLEMIVAMNQFCGSP